MANDAGEGKGRDEGSALWAVVGETLGHGVVVDEIGCVGGQYAHVFDGNDRIVCLGGEGEFERADGVMAAVGGIDYRRIFFWKFDS